MWRHARAPVTVIGMGFDDEELARQVEAALAGYCRHPLASLELDVGTLSCSSCQTRWERRDEDLLNVIVAAQRTETDQLRARLERIEEILTRRIGALACPGCGAFLSRSDGVALAPGVRVCPEHLSRVMWEHPEEHLRAVTAWLGDSGILDSSRLSDRWIVESLLAGVPAAGQLVTLPPQSASRRYRLPARVAERLRTGRTATFEQIAAAAAGLFDVATPTTRTAATQLFGVVCAAVEDLAGAATGDQDARWARIASKAWLANPASRVVAFLDLYRDVLQPDEPFDAGFVNDALAVLTQRGAELLLSPDGEPGD